MIAIGLMSGTSLDGIDAALVRIAPRERGYAAELVRFLTVPYEPEFVRALERLLPPNAGTAQQLAWAHRALGERYAAAAIAVARNEAVDYCALHGQTVFHDGDLGLTTQLGSPYFLRDALRVPVCFDFRSADCALGGHGAPLVPYVDALLLSSADEDRVAVNIGGIANLTFLPRGGAPGDAVAFDSGPGNMLLDAFVQLRSAGAKRYDADGALAARGTVRSDALDAMLADPYFSQAHPKSTGRERFGSHFLAAHAGVLRHLSPEDGAATIVALTACSLAKAIASVAPRGARVLVSGGGVRNLALMEALRERLSGYPVESTDGMQLPTDAKEAVAFALLGYETLRGRAANLPRVTGASGATVLGAIVPHELFALLARMRKECSE